MTSNITKTVERIIKEILLQTLRENNVEIYHPEQYGDSPNRGSPDHPVALAAWAEAEIQ